MYSDERKQSVVSFGRHDEVTVLDDDDHMPPRPSHPRLSQPHKPNLSENLANGTKRRQSAISAASFVTDASERRRESLKLSAIYNHMDEALTCKRHSLVISKEHRRHSPAYKWLHFFHKWFKPVSAEFVATFILLFWACMLQPKPNIEHQSAIYQIMPALSAGLALVIIITIFWDICVIQFNPSVTVSLVMAEIIPLRLLLPNIIAQLSGATLAAYLASILRGYPVGAIPIAVDANWHIILGESKINRIILFSPK